MKSTELNVNTNSAEPVLYESETLNGMLIRFVEIKRDQYRWIANSETALRSLWSSEKDHSDLPLRQTLLRLKREFSRTIKSERELLRNFSIACGLSTTEMPKYYFRGYDLDSPVARKQRERVAAFEKSEANETKPLKLMRKLRSILPYRKIQQRKSDAEMLKEIESLRSETKRLEDMCSELTKESVNQKKRLLEKHGALRMKYEEMCREFMKEKEDRKTITKDHEWHTTRLNSTVRVLEEKIHTIMGENERLRARLERDSNLAKVHDDMMQEQKELTKMCAQHMENLKR